MAALRGLSTEVHRRMDRAWRTDVVVLDADARALEAASAVDRWRQWAAGVVRRHPSWLYLKVDSVLRGHVCVQVAAFLEALGLRRALVVPANPSHGRLIRQGRYTIHGQPLEACAVARDPQYPRWTSDVVRLLLADAGEGLPPSMPVCSLSAAAAWPAEGLIVPDVTSDADLKRLAQRVDDQTLVAGAADFFAALLDLRGGGNRPTTPPGPSLPLEGPVLLVCGSPTAWRERAGACLAAGVPAAVWHETAPADRLGDFPALAPADASAWVRTARQQGALVLALGDPQVPLHRAESMLRRLSALAARIVAETRPGAVLVEGGATAAILVAELGLCRFGVPPQPLPGVGLLVPQAAQGSVAPSGTTLLHVEPAATRGLGLWPPPLWVKPGSYAWPAGLWQALVNRGHASA